LDWERLGTWSTIALTGITRTSDQPDTPDVGCQFAGLEDATLNQILHERGRTWSSALRSPEQFPMCLSNELKVGRKMGVDGFRRGFVVRVAGQVTVFDQLQPARMHLNQLSLCSLSLIDRSTLCVCSLSLPQRPAIRLTRFRMDSHEMPPPVRPV